MWAELPGQTWVWLCQCFLYNTTDTARSWCLWLTAQFSEYLVTLHWLNCPIESLFPSQQVFNGSLATLQELWQCPNMVKYLTTCTGVSNNMEVFQACNEGGGRRGQPTRYKGWLQEANQRKEKSYQLLELSPGAPGSSHQCSTTEIIMINRQPTPRPSHSSLCLYVALGSVPVTAFRSFVSFYQACVYFQLG